MEPNLANMEAVPMHIFLTTVGKISPLIRYCAGKVIERDSVAVKARRILGQS